MPQNDFLPFCPTDTGTNLPTESDYLASAIRTSGNQPGIASSKYTNKPVRQATYIASQLAQMMSNQLGADVLDDAIPAKLLSQMMATLTPHPMVYTKYTATGAATHNRTFVFYIASGNATIGATYTNNTHTFTVKATIAAGTVLETTGDGAPSVNGTLTKSAGVGDATITFYAQRSAIMLRCRGVGAGGGGGGGGTAASNGTAGGDTTVGGTLFVGHGGGRGGGSNNVANSGGTASLGAGVVGVPVQGGVGGGASTSGAGSPASVGAASPYGGAGGNGAVVTIGTNAAANSGSGGGGGAANGQSSGSGGSAGGFFDGWILSAIPVTFAVVVGAKGTGGAGDTGGIAGTDGGDGIVEFFEYFQ